MNNPKKGVRYSTELKHEVCKYYDNHTYNQTAEKYPMSKATLGKWRIALGYRNKHYNYNLYTEDMQPVVQKRQRKNFMVTKQENGDLKARIVALETKLTNSDLDRQWLKNKLHDIADAINTQNDNPVIKLRGFSN